MGLISNLLSKATPKQELKEYHIGIMKYNQKLQPFPMSVFGTPETEHNNIIFKDRPIEKKEIVFSEYLLKDGSMSLSVYIDGLKIGIIYEQIWVENIRSGAVDLICPIYKDDGRFHLYAHMKK